MPCPFPPRRRSIARGLAAALVATAAAAAPAQAADYGGGGFRAPVRGEFAFRSAVVSVRTNAAGDRARVRAVIGAECGTRTLLAADVPVTDGGRVAVERTRTVRSGRTTVRLELRLTDTTGTGEVSSTGSGRTTTDGDRLITCDERFAVQLRDPVSAAPGGNDPSLPRYGLDRERDRSGVNLPVLLVPRPDGRVAAVTAVRRTCTRPDDSVLSLYPAAAPRGSRLRLVSRYVFTRPSSGGGTDALSARVGSDGRMRGRFYSRFVERTRSGTTRCTSGDASRRFIAVA